MIKKHNYILTQYLVIIFIDLINISLELSTHSGLDMAFSWLRQMVESALKVASQASLTKK